MEGAFLSYKYIFKYSQYKFREHEKLLAKYEIFSLFRGKNIIKVEEQNDFLALYTDSFIDLEKLKNLTFTSSVKIVTHTKKQTVIPIQVYLEKIADVPFKSQNEGEIREKVADILKNIHKYPRKRMTRYLVHGFHQYKGRFYPQLVKALLNYAGVNKGDVILDPFCGSGTTLVEARLLGLNSIGVDINPLACLISKVKIESLYFDNLEDLKAEIKALLHRILEDFIANNLLIYGQPPIQTFLFPITERGNNIEELLPPDMPNIDKWFNPDVLKKILLIRKNILKIKSEKIKNLCLLALSNILRQVSNQDPEQLRRMLRKKPIKKVPVYQKFKQSLMQIYLTLYALYELRQRKIIKNYESVVEIYNKDARNLNFLSDNSIDLILTSPPYATALPYLDTDRFSLYFLGFVDRKRYKELERNMIGNREISYKERLALELDFLKNYDSLPLPTEAKQLIYKLLTLVRKYKVGFRRKNTPALLYKYFMDMMLCLKEMRRVLKTGKLLIIIVGENRTKIGEKIIRIDTDDIIAKMAKKLGFKLLEKIPVTPPPKHAIHRKQAIMTETIQVFKKLN